MPSMREMLDAASIKKMEDAVKKPERLSFIGRFKKNIREHIQDKKNEKIVYKMNPEYRAAVDLTRKLKRQKQIKSALIGTGIVAASSVVPYFMNRKANRELDELRKTNLVDTASTIGKYHPNMTVISNPDKIVGHPFKQKIIKYLVDRGKLKGLHSIDKNVVAAPAKMNKHLLGRDIGRMRDSRSFPIEILRTEMGRAKGAWAKSPIDSKDSPEYRISNLIAKRQGISTMIGRAGSLTPEFMLR